jgi:hypothetical protein
MKNVKHAHFRATVNQGFTISGTSYVAVHATKLVLFALAQYPDAAHISSCLLGILSQDFQARLVRQPGFFLSAADSLSALVHCIGGDRSPSGASPDHR